MLATMSLSTASRPSETLVDPETLSSSLPLRSIAAARRLVPPRSTPMEKSSMRTMIVQVGLNLRGSVWVAGSTRYLRGRARAGSGDPTYWIYEEYHLPMRALLVLTEFPPSIGGMQTHAIYLARHLHDRGH